MNELKNITVAMERMENNMQPTGSEKPSTKSTITEFLASPFMLLAGLNLWIATFITGNPVILMEIQYEEDDDEYE
jgi:hypothetical protein